ncbi:uncharacterized protein MYCFIDRAFT_77793 [Pseudocercospora fijiensis CIRAD86]|uniref:Uncharacterized protein n=1 Tax=Pseudocercospora fijiensis (strain CIRAD86) TaxID=383855 RepID=M3AS74_PSEFD|nr:uncharacterized protein MYCFIDRAFT_77793 [Pseudocercospora fijiensis CIRAD86]EME79998.1 hypothetical protein MYCFIDRAFT_77793 [Pseudocercospora fijiensis CIRAD86]
MAIAILAYFVVVDFPNSHRNEFLSAEEKAFVVARLANDRGSDEHAEKTTWRVVRTTALDWRLWSFSFMYFAGAAGIYAFGLFLPINHFAKWPGVLERAVILARSISSGIRSTGGHGPFRVVGQDPETRSIRDWTGTSGDIRVVSDSIPEQFGGKWDLSSLVFRQQDAPDYFPGIYAVIAVNVLGVSLAAVTVIVLKLENRKADRGEKVLEGLTEFRYTL